MNQNEEFINTVKIEDIPWNRLTTAYGMATELPGHLKALGDISGKGSLKTPFTEIVYNIEHQSSLWHSTPFALIFLVRIYHEAEKQKESNQRAAWLVENLEDFFPVIIDCHRDIEEMEDVDPKPLPLFSDMLSEEYLWPADMSEEEEEERWEEGYTDELYVSIWHYSYEVVKEFDV